jgi:tetratricopeptide (TPR) repeat protein
VSAPSTSRRQGLLWLGGIGVAALVVAALAWFGRGHEKVLFVNALDIPVQVTAGDQRFTLAPEEVRTHTMRTGPLDVDVRSDGGTVAHDTVFVTDEGGYFVYNVLGAAPLYLSVVRYYSVEQVPRDDSESQPLPLAGIPFTRVGPIDFLLREPPKRLSMSKEERSVTRMHLGREAGGWKTSYQWLMALRRPADAYRMASSIARVAPETKGAASAAFYAKLVQARREGSLAAIAAARKWRDSSPEEPSAHRLWAGEMRRADRGDEVNAFYAKALAQEPDSVLLAMQLARTEPVASGTKRLETLRAIHPEDPLVRRSLAMRYARQRRWADALPLLDAMEQSDPDYGHFMETHMETLVALGRRDEAVRRLSGVLLKRGENEQFPTPDEVLLYARLVGHSSREGTKNGAMRQLVAWATKDDPDGVLREWLAASLGEPVNATALGKTDPRSGAVRVLMALAEEPEFAAKALAGLDARAFSLLKGEAGLLLAAEFERQGDPALAARTLEQSESELGYGELRDVVWGQRTVDSLETLDAGPRAALHLVRARVLEARGEDSRAAYALVKKEALLPGPVTVALERWERPTPSRAVAGDAVP